MSIKFLIQLDEFAKIKLSFCLYYTVTRVYKFVHFGLFLQGCMNYDDCLKMMKENKEEECKKAPSECTYCCRDKSTCNAHNDGSRNTLAHWRAIVTSASFVILYISNRFGR